MVCLVVHTYDKHTEKMYIIILKSWVYFWEPQEDPNHLETLEKYNDVSGISGYQC